MTTDERFEKIEAGIRDLIVVSRITLDSIGELRESVRELRDAQKSSDERLNALIQAQIDSEQKVSQLAETVDRFIRFRGPNGQTGQA